MSESIKQRLGALQDANLNRNLLMLLNAILVDLTALRTVQAKLVTDMGTRITNHNTLVTKLNADAGVTDTDYASATAITATAPAALTTLS